MTDGWKYFILAAVDVEANFLVVKVGFLSLSFVRTGFGARITDQILLTQAYGYTSLLSCMLLDAWATPVSEQYSMFSHFNQATKPTNEISNSGMHDLCLFPRQSSIPLDSSPRCPHLYRGSWSRKSFSM